MGKRSKKKCPKSVVNFISGVKNFPPPTCLLVQVEQRKIDGCFRSVQKEINDVYLLTLADPK
jgi:hypothetical protein